MSAVTDIKKRPGCALIVFDDGQTLCVPLALLRERRLEKGCEADVGAYAQWLRAREYPHALERAVKFLSLRERSVRETEKHLLGAGYSEDCARQVLRTLSAQGLIDDSRFAALWTDARSRKLGKSRVARELAQKGVDRDTAKKALESVDDQEQLAQAVALAKKALSRTGGKTPAQTRAMQALLRRGYAPGIARRALAIATGGEEMPEFFED